MRASLSDPPALSVRILGTVDIEGASGDWGGEQAAGQRLLAMIAMIGNPLDNAVAIQAIRAIAETSSPDLIPSNWDSPQFRRMQKKDFAAEVRGGRQGVLKRLTKTHSSLMKTSRGRTELLFPLTGSDLKEIRTAFHQSRYDDVVELLNTADVPLATMSALPKASLEGFAGLFDIWQRSLTAELVGYWATSKQRLAQNLLSRPADDETKTTEITIRPRWLPTVSRPAADLGGEAEPDRQAAADRDDEQARRLREEAKRRGAQRLDEETKRHDRQQYEVRLARRRFVAFAGAAFVVAFLIGLGLRATMSTTTPRAVPARSSKPSPDAGYGSRLAAVLRRGDDEAKDVGRLTDATTPAGQRRRAKDVHDDFAALRSSVKALDAPTEAQPFQKRLVDAFANAAAAYTAISKAAGDQSSSSFADGVKSAETAADGIQLAYRDFQKIGYVVKAK